MKRFPIALAIAATALTACPSPTVPQPVPAASSSSAAQLPAPPPAAASPSASSVPVEPTAAPAQPTATPSSTPPVTIGAKESRAPAEAAWQRLADPKLANPLLEGPEAKPLCEQDHCYWHFTATGEQASERYTVGHVDIDVHSGKAWFKPNDGRDQRWEIDAYLAFRRDEKAAIAAVSRLPDVVRYCRRLRAQHQLPCIVFSSEPAVGPCPNDYTIHHECLWRVYVGEQQPTHTVRFASFILHPRGWRVVGVNDPGCGDLPLADWRRYQAATRRHLAGAGPLPECPEMPLPSR